MFFHHRGTMRWGTTASAADFPAAVTCCHSCRLLWCRHWGCTASRIREECASQVKPKPKLFEAAVKTFERAMMRHVSEIKPLGLILGLLAVVVGQAC